MSDYSKNNSEISISSDKIDNCTEIATFLANMNIACSISENISVVPYDNRMVLEKGCRIKIGGHEPGIINNSMWDKLKNKFDLTCAHIHVEGKFKGCIYDYFRKSSCPGK